MPLCIRVSCRGLQPCSSPASSSLPPRLFLGGLAGAPRAAVPREWGARGPAGWPLPRQSFSAAARVECPVARGRGTQPLLPPTGPVGSGRGQPLRGLLPAHLPRTPVLCPSQSQQPTPGPQTVLCTDALRPAPPSRVPWEACGDWELQPGQGSESGNYISVRGYQGNSREGQVW